MVIATPPHWHALPFIEACRRGLDVYCEKPLTYDLREGRAMVEAAKASGRVVQVGFQRRQSPAVQKAREYIAAGHAGRIVTVAAQIHYPASPQLKDPSPVAPPASLDWDAWCGPAPKLPYSAQVGHFNWRLEKAYGNGHLVDWGIHWIDAIRTVLSLDAPRSVQAAGGLYAQRGGLQQRKLSVETTLPVQMLVWADPRWMRQAVWGLLSNAVRFTPDGGWIRLEAIKEEDAVAIIVSDGGVGIAADHQEGIFEPFEFRCLQSELIDRQKIIVPPEFGFAQS